MRGSALATAWLWMAASAGAVQEVPEGAVPRPGEVVDASNLSAYAHLLPEVAIRWIRDGGWLGERARVGLRVGDTRPAPLPESYLAATRRHAAGVSLGADGLLEGWVAGAPFPDPQPPRLATKILWNQYFRWRGDDTVIDTYRTLRTDRLGAHLETRGIFELLAVSGRTDHRGGAELGANRRGVLWLSKLTFTHPAEARWTTTLTTRYRDPTRDDDAHVYLPTTRRVLRVQGGRRCTPVRGSEFTPDDFFGFDGRVFEHEWTLVAEGRTLAVMHGRHVPVELDEHGVWPADEQWELRPVWIVEGVPRDSGYCYGRRRLWIDRETSMVLYADTWDHKGDYWRGFVSTYTHQLLGDGQRGPVWTGTGGYNFQVGHATYVTIGPPERGLGYRVNASDLSLADFTPVALLRTGR